MLPSMQPIQIPCDCHPGTTFTGDENLRAMYLATATVRDVHNRPMQLQMQLCPISCASQAAFETGIGLAIAADQAKKSA